MMTALMIAVFVILAALALFRPRYAIALTIVATPAYLLKGTLIHIPVTALEMALLGTLVSWSMRSVSVDRIPNETLAKLVELPRTIIVPAIVTVAGWLLATNASVDMRASLGALKAWLIEPALFGMMLLVELRRNEKTGAAVVRGLLLLLAWVSVAGLVQTAWFRDTLQDGRLSSVFAPVANYYAMFAAPLFVFTLGLIVIRRERRYAVAAAVVAAPALLLSFSYGGFFAVIVGCMVLVATVVPSVIRRRTFTAITAAVVIGFVAMLPSRHFQEKLNFSTRSSGLVRTEIWRTALEIGTQHPMVGIGPNAFETVYREVAPTLYHPPLEWLVAKPHNLYLNAWVETGAFGVLGLVWGSVALLLFLFRRANRGTGIGVIVAASGIAILTHGLVDTTLFKNDLALIAVTLLALGLSAALPRGAATK